MRFAYKLDPTSPLPLPHPIESTSVLSEILVGRSSSTTIINNTQSTAAAAGLVKRRRSSGWTASIFLTNTWLVGGGGFVFACEKYENHSTLCSRAATLISTPFAVCSSSSFACSYGLRLPSSSSSLARLALMNPHHSTNWCVKGAEEWALPGLGGAIFFICRSLDYIMNLPKQWTLLFLFPVLVNIDLFRQMAALKRFNLELPRVQRSVNLIKIRTRQEAAKKNSQKKIIEKQKRWNLEPSGRAHHSMTRQI